MGIASRQERQGVLEALGLDEAHTAVYRSLLAVPAASAKEAASAVGMPVARVRAIIDDLERLGLLARQASQADRVVASPPAIALKPLLLERERGLTRAHEALLEFTELYREAAEQRNAADVVDVIMGTDAVRQRIGQLQAAANREVRVLVLSDIAVLSGAENVEEDRALERGVRYRVVVESGVLERPGFLDVARGVGALGEEIRVLPKLPTRMFVADDAMALLPMRSHGEHSSAGALLVHPSGLLDLVIAIFEEYWEAATRLLPMRRRIARRHRSRPAEAPSPGAHRRHGGGAAAHLAAHRATADLRDDGEGGGDDPHPARCGGRPARVGVTGVPRA